MTLAFLLAPSHLTDDVGAPACSAGRPGVSDGAALAGATAEAARIAARDRNLAIALRSAHEREARAAFGDLMHAYMDRLVRFAYGIVESADAAEDVVQDVFVRVWERRESIRPEESLRAYLFTAVRRAALDLRKHRSVEARYAARMTQGATLAQLEPITLDDRLDADAIAHRVRAAMARLSERRRTALRLRYEEQLPFAVVAEIMGLSEKAAKHLVTRAVDEVRGYLGL